VVDSVDARVLQHLQKQARPIPLDRIVRELRERRPHISQALLRLQLTGEVSLTSRGEWSATKTVSKPAVVVSGRPGGQSPPPRSVVPEQAEVGERQEAGPDASSRWFDFRRLCLSYAECVRLEERASIQTNANREGAGFIAIDTPLNWRAIASGTPFTVPARPDWRGFLDRIAARSELLELVLGAPVDLFIGRDNKSGDEYRILTPSFVTRVVARRVGSDLELCASGAIEVNHGWLARRVKNEEQRQELLELLGLATTIRRDQDSDEQWSVDTFDQAVNRLFECRREWWKEFAQLSRPTREPEFAKLDGSGIYNRVLLLEPPRLKFGARLHTELLRIALKAPDVELDRSALVSVFPHEPPGATSASSEPRSTPYDLGAAEYALLNADQRDACESALTNPLTVVTGPPGTGKSLVVAHVLSNLAIRGRAALFASRNHQAIEAVEPRLNALTEPRPLMLRPSWPYGQARQQFDWFRMMTELLAKPTIAGAADQLVQSRAGVDVILKRRSEAEKQMQRLSDLRARLRGVQQVICECADRCPPSWLEFAHRLPDVPLAAGIRAVSDQLHAMDKVGDGWLVRVWHCLTAAVRRRNLRAAVLRLVSDPSLAPLDIGTQLPNDPLADLNGTIRVLSDLRGLADLIEALREEQPIRTEVGTLQDLETLRERLSSATDGLHDATRAALRAVTEAAGADLPAERREIFAQLRAALMNRPDELERMPDESRFAKAFRDAAPDLMSHYPLWAVSNLSVGKALPLKAGLFDLVIIDEASQCDIPSIVPLLFRASRAMVVGDPNQLSHVTKLPRDMEMRVRSAHGVNDFAFERFTYRANSAFDVAAYGGKRVAVTLRSHYRCAAPIIDYCNSAFYRGALIVRTDEDALRQRLAQAKKSRACVWTHVDEDVQPASSGCYSPNQVNAVDAELRRLAAAEFPGTIGVVTPFREQANRIRDRCSAVFDAAQRRKWHFIVDTVDGFQGDERDLVLLSLVGGSKMPMGSQLFLAGNPNRFNVAVSRARAVLHVFGDREWVRNSQIPFLAALAEAAESDEGRREVRRSDLIGPVWEPRLAEALRRAGLEYEQQYPTCGYYLDFAFFSNGIKVCAEVDGEAFHRSSTGDRLLDDLYRDTVLEAAGWIVVRFWVYELREDMDACVQRIQQAIRPA